MSGTVIVDGDASQSAGATGRGGLLVDPGQRLRPLRDLDEGRRHRRPRLDRARRRLHGPAGRAGRLRRRRRPTSATRSTRPGSTSAARSPGSAPTASRRRCATSTCAELAALLERGEADAEPADFRRYGSARQLYNFDVDNAGALLMTEFDALRKEEGFDPELGRPLASGAARVGAVRPQHDPRDPADGARGDLRHPRLRRQAPRAALRRPPLPRRQRLPLPARGLPRALRHRRHARHPLRQGADPHSRSRSRSPG